MDLFQRIADHQLNIDFINKYSIKSYYRFQFTDIWKDALKRRAAFQILCRNKQIYQALLRLRDMQVSFETTKKSPNADMLQKNEVAFLFDVDILQGEQFLGDWHLFKLNPDVRSLLDMV